ncbi:MAG: acyl carrier protein [Patescibacteria group bacterium]
MDETCAEKTSPIFAEVREFVVNELGIDPSMVEEKSDWYSDLDMDSLDLFDLLLCAEEEFHIVICDEDANGLNTVGDLTEFLEEHIVQCLNPDALYPISSTHSRQVEMYDLS